MVPILSMRQLMGWPERLPKKESPYAEFKREYFEASSLVKDSRKLIDQGRYEEATESLRAATSAIPYAATLRRAIEHAPRRMSLRFNESIPTGSSTRLMGESTTSRLDSEINSLHREIARLQRQ